MSEGSQKPGQPEPPSAAEGRAGSARRRRRGVWLRLVVLLLAGFVVFLPSLDAPFILDDYLHLSMLEGTFPAKRGPFDLYDFVNEADRPVLAERGMLPWWTHPELKVRFFRPLSSALRWADHEVFGNELWPLHLHSFAWWVLAVLGVRALFRRTLPRRAARIATVVFALAPCHTMPLAWLANREALVSLALGSWAFVAHLRWRAEGRTRDALFAGAGFALALLGGEYALGFGGYLVARELSERGARWSRRVLALVPFALPALGYLAARGALGYGSFGSGFYTDPFSETGAFLREAPRRFAILLGEGWLSLDDETLGTATSDWTVALVACALAAALVFGVRHALRALEAGERRALGWLFAGSLLALVPVLAVMTAPRLLGMSMIGIAAVVGVVLEQAWFRAPLAGARPRVEVELAGLFALALGFVHLVHGPATGWLVGNRFRRVGNGFQRHAEELRAALGSIDDKQVMVLRAAGVSFFLPFALDPRGEPPWRWRTMAHNRHVLVLTRDRRTVDLVVGEDQALFPVEAGNFFRDFHDRIEPGNVFVLPGVRVTVLAVGSAGPRIARFQLDRPLDDPALVWITERRDGFPLATLPAPGFGTPFSQ